VWLTGREAGALDFLAEKDLTAKQLALALGARASNVAKYKKKLEGYGLVRVSKGRNSPLSVEAGFKLSFSEVKASFPALKPSDVLSKNTPLLLVFAKGREFFTVDETGLATSTCLRLLPKLRRLGIISMPTRGKYRLREEAKPIADFARGVLAQATVAEACKELEKIERAVYSFDSCKKVGAIFVTAQDARPMHYWPTALSAAGKYGVQLVSAGNFYYSNEKPDLGDVIIHTLAVCKGERGIIYAAALALKNNYDSSLLSKKKQTFGLGKNYLQDFALFLTTRGKSGFEGFDSIAEAEEIVHGNV